MKPNAELADLEVQVFSKMESYRDKKQHLNTLMEKFDVDELDFSFLSKYYISDYECILIRGLLQRKTSREIAEELNRSHVAINNLFQKVILRKMALKTRLDLIIFIYENQ